MTRNAVIAPFRAAIPVKERRDRKNLNDFTEQPSKDYKRKHRKYKSRRLPPHHYVVFERIIRLIYTRQIETGVLRRSTLTN
jgi:hypothetical protein